MAAVTAWRKRTTERTPVVFFNAFFLIGKTLADQGGYFVELRAGNEKDGNKLADAIINGMERWEIKDTTTAGADQLRDNIKNKQAERVVIRIASEAQTENLPHAIAEAARQQKPKGRKLQSVIVMHGVRLIRIDDMTKIPTTKDENTDDKGTLDGTLQMRYCWITRERFRGVAVATVTARREITANNGGLFFVPAPSRNPKKAAGRIRHPKT